MDNKPESTQHDDSAIELRNKLIKRLAVAGLLVAILLGVLASFDYLSTSPEEESVAPEFSKPVPVAPKRSLSLPVTPSSDLAEPPASATVTETPPPPEPAVQPVVAPPAVPELKLEKAPAQQEPRRIAPASSAAKPAVPPPAPEEPRVLHPLPRAATDAASSVPPSKPAARLADSRPALPGASRLFSGFLLQAGVFMSQQRAEELHAKLTLSGVPSTLETRVQVGPFTTRQEAEAAQAKLKELGVETVLIPPKSAKR